MHLPNPFRQKISFEQQISDLVFENSPDAYFVLKQSRFVHCNKAAERILKMSREDIIGRSPADFSPKVQPDGRDPAKAVAENSALVEKNGFARFEWMHQRPDGTPLPVMVTLTSAKIDNTLYEIVFWQDIRDLVKLREIEQEARAKEQQLIADREAAFNCLAQSLRSLASGDLTCSINQEMVAEYEPLRHDFNATVRELSAIMMKLGDNSEAVRAASEEISSGANETAASSQTHASYVEETAAALEEVSVTVSATSKQARAAGALARDISREAAQSNEIVEKAIEAMLDIEQSSNGIGNILAVIDSIAFQTNLLALNAGVEAARAGDAGKGFAVVAQEVRELAQRSANAAKDIKGLVTKSGEYVQKGVGLVQDTKTTLERIVSRFNEVDQNVDAIATSAREQENAITSIRDAVNNIDRMSQRNATSVEETAAVARALAEQANALNVIANHFTVASSSTEYRRTTAAGTEMKRFQGHRAA